MNHMLSRFIFAAGCLILALAACSTGAGTLDRQQLVDIAWQALEPNTTSHDQAAWQAVSVRAVTGREIRDLFAGKPVSSGCVPGPKPPENAPIVLDSPYWHVQMRPRAATPKPVPTERYSPTAPPHVPEPFVVEARFLVDAKTGQVVARKLLCVIY